MMKPNRFSISLSPVVFEAIHFALQDTLLQMKDTDNFTALCPTACGGLVPLKTVYFRLTTRLCNAAMKPKQTTLTLNYEEALLFNRIVSNMTSEKQASLGILTMNQKLLQQLQ